MESTVDIDAIKDRARCADRALFELTLMIGNNCVDYGRLKGILEGKC